MGYVGNSPAEKYTTIDKQVITGNGTVGPYTLTHSVGNEQEIEVFVNNVRQEPGVAYTVSANQLTMGGTVAAADDFYIVFQGKAKMTATHPPTFDLNAANGTFTGDLTVDTNTLYVDSTSNRVGVGTTSPDEKLHVFAGSAGAVTATTNADLVIENSANSGVNILTPNNQNGQILFGDPEDNDVGRLQYNHTSDYMAFYTNANERMRIDSTGNVGIGTVPESFAKLEVKTSIDKNIAIFDNAAGPTIGAITDAGASQALRIAGQTIIMTGSGGSGAEHMRIDSTGNVGIGTSSPSQLFHLSSSSPRIRIDNTSGGISYIDAATNGVLEFVADDTNVASNSSMRFKVDGTEAMRIDSSGNLLVGQSTTALPGLGNTTTGISLAGNHDIIAASRTSGASVLVNRNTDDGSLIEFSRNGSTVGSIGVDNTDNLTISGNSSHCGLNFSDNDVNPYKNGAYTDGTTDLGSSSSRFKDLHLSGGVVFGATGGAVTSKTLDDYEEGIWYPVLKASTTNPTYTANNTVGYYVKIGNMVYVTWYSSVLNITNSGSGGAQIGNLPFTAASASQEYWLFQYQHGTGLSGTNTSGGYVERNNNNLIFVQQGTVLNSTWVQLNGRYVMISAAYRTA